LELHQLRYFLAGPSPENWQFFFFSRRAAEHSPHRFRKNRLSRNKFLKLGSRNSAFALFDSSSAASVRLNRSWPKNISASRAMPCSEKLEAARGRTVPSKAKTPSSGARLLSGVISNRRASVFSFRPPFSPLSRKAFSPRSHSHSGGRKFTSPVLLETPSPAG